MALEWNLREMEVVSRGPRGMPRASAEGPAEAEGQEGVGRGGRWSPERPGREGVEAAWREAMDGPRGLGDGAEMLWDLAARARDRRSGTRASDRVAGPTGAAGTETAGPSGVLAVRGGASVRLARGGGLWAGSRLAPRVREREMEGKEPRGVTGGPRGVGGDEGGCPRGAGLRGQWVLLKPGAGGAASSTDLPKGLGETAKRK